MKLFSTLCLFAGLVGYGTARPPTGSTHGSPGSVAGAQTNTRGKCMEDNFMIANTRTGGGLVCTAKEVKLDEIHAAVRTSCDSGQNITIDLKANVIFNAARYDVGWYIAKDGGDALNGECYIKPLLQDDTGISHTLVDPDGSGEVIGSVRWDNDKKGANDVCGDIMFDKGGKGMLQQIDIAKDLTLPCIDKTQDGTLDFGICFSWRQPGDDDKCDPLFLFPGTPSKCFCTRYNVPEISVVPPDINTC